MGNRGVLHNEHREVIRNWKLKAWITCLTDFKGRKRQVFSPRRYSELFFLDEVTALSAGHRPCGECRYKDFIQFKSLWLHANKAFLKDQSTRIREIDDVIHSERISDDGLKTTFLDDLNNLPDGVFVRIENSAQMYLVKNEYLYKWSFAGYESRIKRQPVRVVEVLTPRSIVNTFSAGYEPQIHSTIVAAENT